MSLLLVAMSDADTLDIKPYGFAFLTKLIAEGGILQWEREGERREVPSHVLIDTLRIWNDVELFTAKGLHAYANLPIGVIMWDQTEPLLVKKMVTGPFPASPATESDQSSENTEPG
jgi:hypothetical protein